MRLSTAAFLVAGVCISQGAAAEWQLNLAPGATEISRSIYDLHMLIFYICVAIGVVVFGIMLWSIVHHRKSKGAQAAHFHENTLVEIIWTLIPFAILIAMALPASKTLIEMYDKRDGEVTIQITGYQWKWRYQYLNEDIDFFSSLSTPRAQINNEEDKGEHYLLEVDNPLVIPTGTKVRFLLTANDVIHSWWVPALAVKKDAIPGFINEAWAEVSDPGTYRGQCAELCGKDHGFMPIVVEALPADQYQQWLADAKAAKAADAAAADQELSLEQLMSRGEAVYNSQCAACHQANGSGIPGAFPALAGSPLIVDNRAAHLDIVINGKPGTAMQAFGKQLNAVDLAAVITYERNAWGNDLGDSVQPREIKALQP
ncbi:cytochrome c oxidase subunit II [Motiliproteus sediminis]|uniref:cytochrome c oxidase subunit II n=1 Tax=Motiliproteus sediminis TaxID=1468178 RepID=UPI001AEFFDF8|nr:cytochrome c oxidase subunit II [Motiliproteus sediminis]